MINFKVTEEKPLRDDAIIIHYNTYSDIEKKKGSF